MGYKEMCWHSPGLTSSGLFLLAIGIITLAGGGLLLTLVEYAKWVPCSCYVNASSTYGMQWAVPSPHQQVLLIVTEEVTCLELVMVLSGLWTPQR